MRWVPLQVVGGSYRDETRPWSYQDTINFIPEAAEKPGTMTQSILRRAPGMRLFSSAGPSAPVRGFHNVEGTLFAVIGNSLLQVNLDGSMNPLGTIPGIGQVSMAHNQIAGGNQLAIAANNSGYVYDTVAETLAQISDDGFPGSISFAYLNQFIIGIDPTRNFAFLSDLADATSYNTLDRFEAESQPDKLVGQCVTHGELWLFGERTIQPFQDTGSGTGTFQAAQGEIMEVGCAAGATICNLDNSVFWLGNDGIVYKANGYTPQRISTHAVEQAVSLCKTSQAFAFTYEDHGHKIYYLTFPDGLTWGYDAASEEWHRRQSYGLQRWRVNDLVYWNQQWIAGDYANGKLYVLDWDVQVEDIYPMERRRVLGATFDDGNRVTINGLKLLIQTGINGSLAFVLTITGDLPDGYVNDTVDYAYNIVASYGVASVTIISGSLPTGTTMDGTGRITGTRTTAGTYTWTVQVTDDKGNTATLNDSCVIAAEIMPPQLSDWRYLQIDADDPTDYSPADYDDSSWATAQAPFGSWASGATSWSVPHEYDPAFSPTFVGPWHWYTRLWLRRTLTLSEVPPEGIKIVSYVEDNCHFYLNGNLIFYTPPTGTGSGSGDTRVLDASNFVVGDNIIAIRCDDEPAGSGGESAVYADCYMVVA